MSGSISDSEACGNYYDYTWSPPTEETGNDWNSTWNPIPETATKSISNFTHSWKKIDIFLVDSGGNKEIISDETGCFVPVKFQYLITHRLHHLQSLIEKIQLLDVKSIQTSDEFVEITTKTDVHSGAGAEVSTVLSNELEDIYLKIIPRLPFTCTIAEELFHGYVELMVARDESKVYIVGPLTIKTLLCNTIDQFKNLINKETIIFDEKWKVLAMAYLNAVQFLATRYPNVSVKIKEDTKIVLLQGTKSEVQNAVKELHDLVDSLHVEHIHLDPLVIKLLHFSDASSLFTSIIKSQRLDVSWTIDGDNLIVVSKETIPIGSVQQLVVENFVSAGFSSEADSQNDFTKSKAFLDQVQANKNSLLVAIKESNGYRVASTKAVIRVLLQNEHSHNDMVCKSEQVNDIDDEVSKLRLELNSTKERLICILQIWKI